MEREEQFKGVFDRAYPAVARYVRNHGYRGQDAEDLVANTFEVVWKRLDAVPPGDGAIPWILAVARNLARNTWRRTVRERDLVGALATLGSPAGDGSGEPGQERWDEVCAALTQLKPIDRELILLVAWDELEPSAAGKVLGLSPTAARSRLHRARQRLAALLSPGPDQPARQTPVDGLLTSEERP